MYKKLFFNLIILMGLVCELYSSESLLEEDIEKLNSIGLGKYEMTEADFLSFFPCEHFSTDPNKSRFVGQIVSEEGIGRATGFVSSMEEKNGLVKILGVSTLHTFCRIGNTEGNPLVIDRGLKFILARKALVSLNYSEGTNIKTVDFGTFKIEKIFFNLDEKRITSTLNDLCVFQGVLENKGGLILDNQNYVKYFSLGKINFLEDNSLYFEKIRQGSPLYCTIYHYPDGKKEMRKNKGTLIRKEAYKIRTLGGSSGAPLFIDSDRTEANILLGIHTGVIKTRKDVEAIYKEPVSTTYGRFIGAYNTRYFDFAKESLHGFESITCGIYNEILNGINLYNLEKRQELVLHMKLLYVRLEIENIKIKDKLEDEIKEIEKKIEEIPQLEEFPI